MASVLFLFLAHLAVGIAASLLLVGQTAGVKFFRFNAGLAAVLLLIALAFRPAPPADAPAAGLGFGALLVAAGALLVYWATIGRALARLRPLLLWTTALGGGIALVAQAWSWSVVEAGPSLWLTVASFLSSAALLGGSCTAMILGHWYLVLPSMDVSLLQRIVKFHIGSTVVRIAVVGVVIAAALANLAGAVGSRLRPLRAVHRRGLPLAAGAVRAARARRVVVPDVGDGEDPLHAVGHRHSLRRLLHGDRRRGAGEVSADLAAGAAVNLTFICPECASRLPIEAAEAPTAVRCGACDRAISLAVSDKVRAGEELDVCPVCEGGDFYVRKDFDPKLGLAVIIAGALVSAGFYWFGMDLVAYGVLGGAALLDLVVYGRLRDLSVCYRCHTEFRGDYRRTGDVFDLHTADELELEWARRLGER